jgi:hypothetical protein
VVETAHLPPGWYQEPVKTDRKVSKKRKFRIAHLATFSKNGPGDSAKGVFGLRMAHKRPILPFRRYYSAYKLFAIKVNIFAGPQQVVCPLARVLGAPSRVFDLRPQRVRRPAAQIAI